MTSQETNGTAVDHYSAATPTFKDTTSTQFKSSGSVSSTNSIDTSLKQGKYIPPHIRNRLLNHDSSSATRELNSTPSSESRSASTYSDNYVERRSNGYDARDNRSYDSRRSSHYSSTSSSNSHSDRGSAHASNSHFSPSSNRPRECKWKEPEQEEMKYDSSGLLPRDLRLERELFEKPNTGINFDKYEEIPVEATGEKTPPHIEKFSDIDLGPVVANNIQLAQFTVPTPVQKYALPIVMAGRDMMACAQTGSGKTAAFLFPLIARLLREHSRPSPTDRYRAFPYALILVPTRELALQIHLEARKFTYRSHLQSVVVYGGADYGPQARALERGCDILVATPGRLIDFIERRKVSLTQVQYLCLDEADRMLDMGFEKQIRRIVEDEGMPGVDRRQTLMFSATFPKEIQKLAQDFLSNYIFLRVGRVGSTTDFITQRIRYVEDKDKQSVLVDVLSAVKGLTLIFVETKRGAEQLENFLYKEGFPTTSIHGDRAQREREAALHSFRTAKTPILVATDVAARGLDIPNVAHVINFDLPNDIDAYVHRIGRTGRAGNNGLATAFYNDKNKNIVRDLVDLLQEAGQEVPTWLMDAALDAERIGMAKTNRYGRGRWGGGRGGHSGRWGGSYGGAGYGGTYNGTTYDNGNSSRGHHQQTSSYGGQDIRQQYDPSATSSADSAFVPPPLYPPYGADTVTNNYESKSSTQSTDWWGS
jgi:ATP-dependent RNA helicase DDX3X